MRYRKSNWYTQSSLFPGQRGTVKETREYGESLVCVRYRYDENSKRRIKTVELVIDEKIVNSKIKAPTLQLSKYPCRGFKSSSVAPQSCSNCGWPRQDHTRQSKDRGIFQTKEENRQITTGQLGKDSH